MLFYELKTKQTTLQSIKFLTTMSSVEENIRFWSCNLNRECSNGRLTDQEIEDYIRSNYPS